MTQPLFAGDWALKLEVTTGDRTVCGSELPLQELSSTEFGGVLAVRYQGRHLGF
jgi:hypothetical protein